MRPRLCPVGHVVSIAIVKPALQTVGDKNELHRQLSDAPAVGSCPTVKAFTKTPRFGAPAVTYCFMTVPSGLRISPQPPFNPFFGCWNGALAAAASSISMPQPGFSLIHR